MFKDIDKDRIQREKDIRNDLTKILFIFCLINYKYFILRVKYNNHNEFINSERSEYHMYIT